MAVEGDESISLPTPPPPRPAARQSAIEAALRKFDGAEESAPSPGRHRPSGRWWATMHRRPAGALVTAALIAIVSVPAAMIALRDQPSSDAPRMREPPAQPQKVTQDRHTGAPEAAEAPLAPAPPAEPARKSIPLPMLPHDDESRLTANAPEAAAETRSPAPMIAPSAPPPPPPPPAPAPQQYEADSATEEMVVTGSRVARPKLEEQSNVSVMAEQSAEAGGLSVSSAHRAFLSRLQGAVRAGNRRAVLGLVALPLRVNFSGGARTYRDRRSIERDFDLIFTPRVRKAILNQQSGRLFTNYQGAMIGDGQVWFDETCPNSACSPAGPVRIRAINP